MKKMYESPEFEKYNLSFESMMDGIQYSKPEDYKQSGDEGDDSDIPGGWLLSGLWKNTPPNKDRHITESIDGYVPVVV